MLDKKSFDLWADGYDRSVDICDEDNTYPFAGYKKVLAEIYEAIREGQGKRVLDIGFGTGVLSCKLYKNGYDITGIDFSKRMIQIAQEQMPSAKLIQQDFRNGLPAELAMWSEREVPGSSRCGILEQLTIPREKMMYGLFPTGMN